MKLVEVELSDSLRDDWAVAPGASAATAGDRTSSSSVPSVSSVSNRLRVPVDERGRIAGTRTIAGKKYYIEAKPPLLRGPSVSSSGLI